MVTENSTGLKFAMMSGALKNAGDFLIVKRCEELVRHIYPNAELFFYDRGESLENDLEEINKLDAMIFCGGPAYLPQLYPNVFPLTSDLNRIQIPMFALGLGWFGSSSANKAVYRYSFDNATLGLLKRIERDTKILGCRDWYSVNVLRNNGIWAGKMTGCPAWYDLNYVEQQEFSRTNPYQIKKVCISDSANISSHKEMMAIVSYMRQLFPKADIKVVFHRGIQADKFTGSQAANQLKQAVAECEALGADCMDISYGKDGFSVYDDCDLHIGFRVHAHIYNLSRRNASILVEEDGRGAGVNHALGLESIMSYDYGVKIRTEEEHVIGTVGKVENRYLLQRLDDYINNLYQADFLQLKNAFRLMQSYYRIMEHHIQSICKYL